MKTHSVSPFRNSNSRTVVQLAYLTDIRSGNLSPQLFTADELDEISSSGVNNYRNRLIRTLAQVDLGD